MYRSWHRGAARNAVLDSQQICLPAHCLPAQHSAWLRGAVADLKGGQLILDVLHSPITLVIPIDAVARAPPCRTVVAHLDIRVQGVAFGAHSILCHTRQRASMSVRLML